MTCMHNIHDVIHNKKRRVLTTGCEGKNGAKCCFTPIGPMPGPPPPWGMQNVLWRLRWQTSAPIQPGLVSPTCTRKPSAKYNLITEQTYFENQAQILKFWNEYDMLRCINKGIRSILSSFKTRFGWRFSFFTNSFLNYISFTKSSWWTTIYPNNYPFRFLV